MTSLSIIIKTTYLNAPVECQIYMKQPESYETHQENGKPLVYKLKISLNVLLGITHLCPHNELVHLPYIAVATNTRAD